MEKRRGVLALEKMNCPLGEEVKGVQKRREWVIPR